MSDYASLLAILRKLVSFQTVAGQHKQIRECIEYIENRLDGHGLFINRYSSNGHSSLVISTKNTKHPAVLLQAHVDVVPAYPEQFKLDQKSGKLYGRGVYDMKFAVACYLELLHDLKPDLNEYDLAVMLTFDEEEGGHDGVEYLLNQGLTADFCLLPDGGDNWNIEASAKGYSIATITTKGKSAHGSRPWEADNAGLQLIEIVRQLQITFPYEKHLATTVTPTILQAGSASNQIPGEARATLDIRYPAEEDYAQTKQKLSKLCQTYGAEVIFDHHAAAVRHDTDAEAFDTWQAIVKEIVGAEPDFTHSFGASDARYLVPLGIPTLITRPYGGGQHSGEEWISEKGFYDFYEVLRKFVEATARTPVDL